MFFSIIRLFYILFLIFVEKKIAQKKYFYIIDAWWTETNKNIVLHN